MESSLKEDILRLKKEKNVLIMAHHYQSQEVKNIADYTGDSLELARIAATTDADTIVLCGVYFMAETAKILSPHKKVLLPNLDAGCPMADMITAEQLIEVKKQHPNTKVVCYVNSSAEVKAESDICCTSSNAVKIVRELDAKEILFVPDQNLGHYVQSQLPDKKIHLWRGFCPTHHRVTSEDVIKMKIEYPNAVLFAHPECKPEVLKYADYIGSTSQIIKECKESIHSEILIGTEEGIMDTLIKDNPTKNIILLNKHMSCPNMKKTTLAHVKHVLETGENEITVDEHTSKMAHNAIVAMIERS